MERMPSSSPQDPETAGDKTSSVAMARGGMVESPPLPSFATEAFLASAASSSSPATMASASPPYLSPTRTRDAAPTSMAPPPGPSGSSADASSEFDVMAQLAYFNSVSSRNRSFSAPIPPSSLGATWNSFTDDTRSVVASQPPLPPPVLNMRISPPSSLQVENAAGAIGSAVGSSPTLMGDMQGLSLGAATTTTGTEPENEPTNLLAVASAMDKSAADLIGAPLPATFLRTICDQLEFYFCDENLLGDLFLLKNMNMDGYVKLDLLASFGRVKKLTTDLDQLKKALELSTKLLLNEDESMVCRKEPLSTDQTYHGKLARTAIAYNLPEDASVASLREKFQGCGEITYLRLLKKNTTTGRNAVLKPPIAAGETYAIIEFVDEEMAKHAVLTLSDQYNWRTGMQVVLFDGTNCDKLKQKMFPVEMGGGGDRRRAKSASAISRPVHVEAVGEGLDDLREGKVSTGVVYSIRGAGGLITPTRQDSACISFRLIPDEDGNVDIRQGDYVSFTVGKNKKSGRKYASKVKLEFRPPSSLTTDFGNAHGGGNSSSSGSGQKDYFAPSPSRWESRSRAATVGAPPPAAAFRGRSSSSGTRPKLNLSSPRLSQSPPTIATPNGHSSSGLVPPPGLPLNGNSNPLYRQALGPDGTRGFGFRRPSGEPELFTDHKFTPMPTERRRSRSTGGAMHPF